MLFKRLELWGFKSFATRTFIDFLPGVSLFVGPNGVGKSNILDAIKWVLGEQSARSLRGSRMGDVIFNGSATQKPANFAQVSLTITNDGTQRRDFTYVQDVVEANILASTSEKVGQGEVINIGRGNNYSVNEIAEIIGGETEFIGDRLEPYETLANNTKAKELLGWEPKVDIKEWLSS